MKKFFTYKDFLYEMHECSKFGISPEKESGKVALCLEYLKGISVNHRDFLTRSPQAQRVLGEAIAIMRAMRS